MIGQNLQVTTRDSFRPNLFFQIWQALGSDRLLIFWLICLVAIALSTVWLPQAPRNIYLQESSLQDWLDMVRPEIGGAVDNLLELGLLTITRSIWFRILLAGTTLTLLIRLFNALQALIDFPEMIRPEYSRTGAINDDVQSILQLAGSWLKGNWRKKEILDSENVSTDNDLIGKKNVSGLEAFRPLSAIGPLCIVMGCLTVLAGWYWNDLDGWTYPGIRIHNNSPEATTFDQTTIRMMDLTADWLAGKKPIPAHGTLEIWQDDLIASGELSPDQDWRWQGVVYRMDSVGPAVQVRGKGPDGSALTLQTTANQPPADELTLPLSMADDLKSFAAPDEGIVIQLGIESSEDKPQVRVRAYQGREGELIINQLVDQSVTLEINDSLLTLAIIPYAVITATYSPGNPLLVTGAILALAGVITSATYRSRHMKLVVSTTKDKTQVTLYTKQRDAKWLDGLAEYLELEYEGNDDDE